MVSPDTKSTFELSENSTMDYHSLESYVCTLPESCITSSEANPVGTITFSHTYCKLNKVVFSDSKTNIYYRRLLEIFIRIYVVESSL